MTKEKKISHFSISLFSSKVGEISTNLTELTFTSKISEIILGILLTVIGSCEMYGALRTLQKILNIKNSSEEYSVYLSMCLLVWDCMFCIISFSYCVSEGVHNVIFR